MNRRRRIYEGKAKILYEGPEPGTLIQFFKDDATAFNKKKHEIIDGKGVLNNRISEYIFTHLNKIGIPTHFIRRLNMREQLIKEVEIIPLEIVVRNVAAGSLAKRLGIEEGVVLPRSIIEFYYKSDALDDPMVSEEHITAFGWANPQELDDIMALAIRVNDFLTGLFLGVGIQLVDFKIECGRLFEGDMMRIILADEISPDSCRLWDVETQEKMDKDRFRRDMGGLVEAYSGSGPPPRHHERKRAAARHRPGSRQVPSIISARSANSYDFRRNARDQGSRNRHAEERRSRPAGQGDRRRARRLGFDGVGQVRQGKVFDLEIEGADKAKAEADLKAMCEKLLANTVIENYTVSHRLRLTGGCAMAEVSQRSDVSSC